MPACARVIADSDDDSDFCSVDETASNHAATEEETYFYAEEEGLEGTNDTYEAYDEDDRPSIADNTTLQLDVNFDAFLSQTSYQGNLSGSVKQYPQLYGGMGDEVQQQGLVQGPGHEQVGAEELEREGDEDVRVEEQVRGQMQTEETSSGSTGKLLKEITDAQTDLVETTPTSNHNVVEYSRDMNYDGTDIQWLPPQSSLAERVKLKRNKTVDQVGKKNELGWEVSAKASKRRKTMKTYGTREISSQGIEFTDLIEKPHRRRLPSPQIASTVKGPEQEQPPSSVDPIADQEEDEPVRKRLKKGKAYTGNEDVALEEGLPPGQILPDLDDIPFLKSSNNSGEGLTTSPSLPSNPRSSHKSLQLSSDPQGSSSEPKHTSGRAKSLAINMCYSGDTEPFSSIPAKASHRAKSDGNDDLPQRSQPDLRSELSLSNPASAWPAEKAREMSHMQSKPQTLQDAVIQSEVTRNGVSEGFSGRGTNSRLDSSRSKSIQDREASVVEEYRDEKPENQSTKVPLKDADESKLRDGNETEDLGDDLNASMEAAPVLADTNQLKPTRGRGRPRKNAEPKSDHVVKDPIISDEVAIDLPEERYKPRPSRSRGQEGEVLEELDFGKKKKSEPKKKKLKRGKTMSVTQIKRVDSDIEDDVIWVNSKAVDEHNEVSEHRIHLPEMEEQEKATVPTFDENLPESGPVSDPPKVVINEPAPKKRGRKRKKTSESMVAEESEQTNDIRETLNTTTGVSTNLVDNPVGGIPNETNLSKSNPELLSPSQENREPSPSSLRAATSNEPPTPPVETPKKQTQTLSKGPDRHSPISSTGKVPYRVGLSRRANIQPLLKIRRR